MELLVLRRATPFAAWADAVHLTRDSTLVERHAVAEEKVQAVKA